ncbi:MAG: sulfatase-like hydrolase/transferase [Tannerella sp.]|jgi:phosphoglycerol transferase MdoB-like AlkP superfamily enzyme|nr:sulfatase-like hydrolase/transferase [Tannerella sp.]
MNDRKSRPDNITFFLNGLLHTLLVYVCLLFIFCFFRVIIFINFEHPGVDGIWKDLCKAFFYGFLLDTRTAAYALAPVIIYNAAGQLFQSSIQNYYRTYNKVCRIYYTILITFVLFISTVDFFYLNYYKTHINVFAFGIFEDDTMAVLKTIWDEYPVILMVLFFSIAAWIIYRLTGYARKKIHIEIRTTSRIGKIGIVILSFALLFTGGRGSLGFSPFRTNNSVVSVYRYINNLVFNGTYALGIACIDRTSQKVHADIPKALKAAGFSSPEEAISVYLDRKVAGDPDSLINALQSFTPVDIFLQNNPPHVVLIVMESMSQYFLSLHDKENLNLLGSLEDVMSQCIWFTHFFPAVSSTIYSLECLLVKNVKAPISHSYYVHEQLETSSVIPFKANGYEATFITGSKLSWRNMDKFIPQQFFDRVEGQAHLENHVASTSSSAWGVYDEFLFDRIYNILCEHNEGQPQFVFGLTTSNHPPYTFPESYDPLPVNVPKHLQYKHTSGADFTKKHLLTYQYANDCLGKFIQKIKASPLGENTIIAVTGDHNARSVFDYPDMNPVDKYAVPFMLYIPDLYKERLGLYDTGCFASHKDVFPTLYHLALSGTPYVNSGVNLLDKRQTDGNFGITENSIVLTGAGCIQFEMKPVYYVWYDPARTVLKPAGKEDIPELNKAMIKGKSFLASMNYLIQRSIKEK